MKVPKQIPTKYVFINGYGLVKFKPVKSYEYDNGETQFKGVIKLPKNVWNHKGEKWVKYPYYFSDWQVFNTRLDAANSIFNPYNPETFQES
jgi:hypothetical protein